MNALRKTLINCFWTLYPDNTVKLFGMKLSRKKPSICSLACDSLTIGEIDSKSIDSPKGIVNKKKLSSLLLINFLFVKALNSFK
jgi:hypothetical protein